MLIKIIIRKLNERCGHKCISRDLLTDSKGGYLIQITLYRAIAHFVHVALDVVVWKG